MTRAYMDEDRNVFFFGVGEKREKTELFSIFKLISIAMELSKLNPDWELAELHGISTFPGIVTSHGSEGSQAICPCCLNTIHKEQAPLCENSKELQFLGFGFPLFYVFIKYCIILLMVSICCYNALQIYWGTIENHDRCNDGKIDCSFMLYLSRIPTEVDNAEVVVRVFSFVVQLGVLLYIRDLITKTRNYYDERTCSLSDYSILITNLPERKGMRQRLLKFLAASLDKPYSPHQITFLPQYEKFYEMEENVGELIKKIKSCINSKPSEANKQLMQQLEAELQTKEKQLQKYCEKELELEENDECIAEKLIFSCGTEDEKDQIIEKFDKLSEEQIRQAFGVEAEQECAVGMQEAPEPKQINWEHINYPSHRRVGRMIAGWVMTTVFLGAITTIFFFLLSEKSILIEESFPSSSHSTSTDATVHSADPSTDATSSSETADSSHSSYTAAVTMVYMALIGVIFFNKFVMGLILHKICDFERHPTTAQEEFHFALKYSVGMFFTTALMTLAVEDLRFHNFYQHPYGVIQEEFVMFFMNALFVPFIWLINPWQLGVLIKRKFNYGRKDLTQKEANKIMENMQYNMGKRYAEIIEIMWFTYLYASLIPAGACLSVIGLCLYYWIDKYNLLRRSSVNSNIAGQLSLFSMKLLDFTLLCKPIGEMLFDSQIRNSYCISSVVMATLAVIYLATPMDRVLQFFHPEKFKAEEKAYEDVQSNFKNTYQTLHPIFSLKKENQAKVANAFGLIGHIFDSTIDPNPTGPPTASNLITSPFGLPPKPTRQERRKSLQIENMSQSEPSAHHLNLKAFKDTTNILQTLIKGKPHKQESQKEHIDE